MAEFNKAGTSVGSNELNAALWAAADEMRRVMSADVYKDYLLGLIFYKALSDRMLYEAVDLLENRVPQSLEEAQDIYASVKESPEDWKELSNELSLTFGVCIEPEHTFIAYYRAINNNTFMLSDLRAGFRNIEAAQNGAFSGLFEDFDIESKDLGKTMDKRNEMLSSVIKVLAHIDFTQYGEDALGDAYEYLISMFAAESGKKAGEFYTPQAVSSLITRIVTAGREHKEGFSIYDPAMGSGSLLLQVRNYMYVERDENGKPKKGGLNCVKNIQFYGQEIKNQTYNLARMNMMLHRVKLSQQHLRNGDTLDADWPTDEPTTFDAVVMNPPYSQKYSAAPGLLEDPRFSRYERLPPASKADFAFLLHGFYHLKNDGVMGIVLPHGVLFRGAAEGVIRRHLLENGSIYAVIGLPANIFFSTGIPTCVIVLKKDNTDRSVLFIDASHEFEKERARNVMTEEHIEKIFNAFIERNDIEKFAHLASFEEIKDNDFNLNIPRYVDNFEDEEQVDLNAVIKELNSLKKEEADIDLTLKEYFDELGISINI
ncbi:MAG: type I restriction-modification system subunit M [Proteobacteria bacterium]|uniref:site-specific DNA-methyltransferase (adenine-specific) n=1 Tax=Candidatus Avisuccinivibrio stercorigallinarum TaxID=2840704 RepID=A0A9D9DAU2_9GAMM|nr:type I restriction-modification system subunit M [Candidatus Avisuccinivibrio stercorigallinarum]